MKTTVARTCANTTVDDERRDSSYSPFEVHICWKLRESKKNPSVHTGYFHTGEERPDLHCGWRQRRQLLRHALKNALKHGRAT